MNRLIKIFSFVLCLSFSLLLNVSYAEFSTTPLPDGVTFSSWGSKSDFTIGSYSSAQIKNIINNFSFYPNNSDYVTTFNVLMEDLLSEGYRCFVFKDANYSYITLIQSNISVGVYEDSGERVVFTRVNESLTENNNHYFINSISSKGINFIGQYANGKCQHYDFAIPEFVFSNVSIKRCVRSGGWTWDGSSYYYEVAEEPEGDTPSLPSNSEITQAVQLFYNTIYNQPNISFDDFIVLYDNSTGLYSYIGHTRGNAIGQVIVEPNGYYNGYKFDTQWWQFYLDEQNDSWEWQNLTKYNNYFLYSSQGSTDTLKYVGKDKISNLFTAGPYATSNTVIVYSTNDYPVKYITFTEDSPEPVVETGTIKGDQYTYDENLDITDNNYNPLDNFVTVDPVITIIGNVDFDEINKVFEENKDILIIQNASWLFTANNQLVNYFIGFLSFLIVLIIISRLLGG